jgi:PhnB protein
MPTTIKTSIEPWLTISGAGQAIAFYKKAFGAVETYRLADPGGGVVVRLSINGTQFWVSGVGDDNDQTNITSTLGGNNVRMILIVNEPENMFKQAIDAGATEIFPVGEEYGWKLGRVCDPFGLHWEIGYQLGNGYS